MVQFRFTSYILVVLSTILFLSSCKNRIHPDTPTQLYEKYRKSVVLITTSYYYEIELSNGIPAYFTEQKNGEISDYTFDEEEVKKNLNTVYGTGFFISKDGVIATNRHVVYPEINEAKLLSTLKLKFDKLRFSIYEYQRELSSKISEIDNYVDLNFNRLDLNTINELKERKITLAKEREKLSILNVAYDFDPSKSLIKPKASFIGIAYDNTYVNRQSDFKECVLIKKSNNKSIDLALVQLKDKTTPLTIQNIFNFEDQNPNIKNGTMDKGEGFEINKPLKIDTKVYMIGFNHGYEVANTENGIRAQLTQGTISQESDNNRVLYSIPTLPGSSGSPIIDQWGNLVAINFGKISNTQNFNYGITSKHLKALIQE